MRQAACVVVRGGGELGSAAARLMFLAGFRVVVLERPQPLAVRRRVCFAEAVWSGEASVEGVLGRRVEAAGVTPPADEAGAIPVAVDPEGRCLPRLRPGVLVDARMFKQSPAEPRPVAAMVIGLGPGFLAGSDVDAVIETQRGANLGRVAWSGSAQPDTGRPSPVLGVDADRVLRAPRAGVFRGARRIGDLVVRGARVGDVAGDPVLAGTAGLIRGLLHDDTQVEASAKVGDVDPRGTLVDPARVSDKARAVAAGVLEAALIGMRRGLGSGD